MGNINNNLEIKSKDKDLESDMKEYENEKFSGIGIKKMKAYKCDLTLNELNQKRERFWKLKMNPKHKNWTIWKVIKQAVDYDEHRASLLLDQYDISDILDKNLDEYNLERIIFESNFSTPDLPKYWDKLLNLAFIYTQLKFRPYI